MRIGRLNIEFYNPRRMSKWNDVETFSGERSLRPFAYADVQAIMMMITNRMVNVEFQASTDFDVIDKWAAFLKSNALKIISGLFYDGAVAVDVSEPFHPRFFSSDNDELNRVCESNIVRLVDDVYRMTGNTMAHILAPQLELLNAVNDSDLNLIVNYGAMGVLSPENSARVDGYLDDEQREEIQNEYRKRFGVRFGKWALMISRMPLKFQPIQLPIAELQLAEKRKSAIAEILQYLNVPKELHAMFDSAKYANRNEAELDMYGNTVSKWAAVFVSFLTEIYQRIRINDDHGIGYPADNEFWFDIVGVPALQENQYKEKLKAREELKMWQELKVSLPEHADYIDARINDLIESL